MIDDDEKGLFLNIVNSFIDKKIINRLIELSNYEKYGAKKINEIVKDKIENLVIEEVFKDKNDIYNLVEI